MNKYQFSDIFVGLEESFEVTIKPSMFDLFLELSGDNNPLHINHDYAVKKGFSSNVAYGLLTSSFYSTLVGVYLPGHYCILHGIDIQFTNPAYSDDRLIVKGKVSYINESFKQVEIKASIINQNNIKISKAKIRVGVIDE